MMRLPIEERSLATRVVDGLPVVHVEDGIQACDELVSVVAEYLDQGFREIILSFANTTTPLDSSALRAVARAYVLASQRNATLRCEDIPSAADDRWLVPEDDRVVDRARL